MIPVFICDDEPQFSALAAKLVKNEILIHEHDIGPVEVLESPEQMMGTLAEGKFPAIYFLDIDFPGDENGLQLASRIRTLDPRGFIIFVTGHDDLAVQTFKYRIEAMDYIVKGDEDRMREQIRACLISINQRMADTAQEQSPYFTIKIFDTLRHIPVSELLYFEAVGKMHQIRIHMDEEILEFYGSLKEQEEELGDSFFRCHRGYLVNTARIKKIHLAKCEIELDNGEICLLSRRLKNKIPDSLKTD